MRTAAGSGEEAGVGVTGGGRFAGAGGLGVPFDEGGAELVAAFLPRFRGGGGF